MVVVNAPTVSVVTPNYNHGHFIEKAIRSVAAQECTVLEHVIVDDGSTDDSVEVISGLARLHPLVRLVTFEENRGPVAALHRGMIEAKGDFVIFLGADDSLPTWSLARAMEIARRDPAAVLICGDVAFVDETKNSSHWHRYFNVSEPIFISPDELVKLQGQTLNVINGGAAVLRRSALFDVGFDDAALRWHLDFIVYNTIAYRAGVWYIPSILHQFTITGKNFSNRARTWALQKPVLDHVFERLCSPEMVDVRDRFRDSAILATVPFILRYLNRRSDLREFVTPRLVLNAGLHFAYSKVRALLPQSVLDFYLRQRTKYRK